VRKNSLPIFIFIYVGLYAVYDAHCWSGGVERACEMVQRRLLSPGITANWQLLRVVLHITSSLVGRQPASQTRMNLDLGIVVEVEAYCLVCNRIKTFPYHLPPSPSREILEDMTCRSSNIRNGDRWNYHS